MREMEPLKLPISVPLQAVWLRGLSIEKGDPQPETGGYLQYSDQEGRFHEVSISLSDQTKLIEWLKQEKLDLPLKVR